MYARQFASLANLHKTDQEMIDTLQPDLRRALRGLQKLSESEEERAFALHWGLRFSYDLCDPVEARKYFDLLNKYRLENRWEKDWWYSNLHANLARSFAIHGRK